MLKKIQKQVQCTTAPTFADSLALKKTILMWSVLASSIGTLLEYTHNLLTLSVGGIFSKKSFSRGHKPFEETYWGLFYMGGLMIALCEGRGSFTDAFSSNLNTTNPKVFLKHGGTGFIFEVNSLEVLNIVPCSVPLKLTLAWGSDILFEKLTPEIGG